jgi:hypothetical protein
MVRFGCKEDVYDRVGTEKPPTKSQVCELWNFEDSETAWLLCLQIYKGASIAPGQQQAVVSGIGWIGVHARHGKLRFFSSTFLGLIRLKSAFLLTSFPYFFVIVAQTT